MSKNIGRLLSLVGITFLIHSAYSTYEHLSYLNAVDKAESGLPIEIVAECLISVVVSLVGVVLCAGDLKNILMENEMKKQTIDKLDTAPSFITFNHRGRRAISAHSLLQRRNHMS
ncbi:membrane magnesium transporter-domain-containing protein [Umbelopsis sp. PMI_123]|nr:membrane magnesium transporter-domain-containing protein [Umbelopsis sp. PMI_123]